jgi:copper transport protein
LTRVGRRLLLVIAVTVIAVAGWAEPAFAHAQLLSTNPASGSVLAKSPGVVVLHFGEDVEIQFGAVRVFNSNSKRIDDGAAYHPNGDGHSVAVKVPSTLATGGYVVTWRVISADSHPVHGAFTFLIGSGGANAAQAANSQATRLLATTGGSVTVGVVFGIVRFAAFAALFVLVGGAAFVAGAWPEGREDERARWLLRVGLIAALVTTLAAIALQGPYGGGLPLLKAFSPAVFREVLKTRFGQVYLARILILLVAGIPLLRRLLRSGPLPRWWAPAALLTGAAILVTPGLAGHAATGSLVVLAVPFDLVHPAGAAVWVGGLSVLAVAVLVPRRDKEKANPLRTVLPRYSQWALAAVLAIAVSGGFAAWRQIGSLSAVTTTTFGRLVLAKTIIFVVLVAVATRSRRLVHGSLALPFGLGRLGQRTADSTSAQLSPGPGAMAAPAKPTKRATWETRQPKTGRPVRKKKGPQRQSDLRKAVLVELLLAAAIIAVTAVLVNAQPARQALALPFSGEVHAGPNILVDLVVDPAKAGPVAIHVYTLSADGAQLDVPEVDATMSLPALGSGALTVPLQKGGVGHFLVAGFQVPLKGKWTINITVRTTEFDEFDATPIKVNMR